MQYGPLTITYDDRVLRPRQWTVAQATWAASLLRASPPGEVLELCSGAGHIGVLALSGSGRRLVQVDACATACEFARANALTARRGQLVDVRLGEMHDVLEVHERFVGVIADPPWVPSGATSRYPEDPLMAIHGGPDGLDVAWGCLRVGADHLVEHGWMLLQLGTRDQVETLAARLAAEPRLSLEIVETRMYEGGAVVRLARVGEHVRSRPPASRTGPPAG